MWGKVNVSEELRKAERKSIDVELSGLFEQEAQHELAIQDRIANGKNGIDSVDIFKVNRESLFRIETIQKMAIQYRLKFLPSAHYIGEIPTEAVLKVKEIEKEHETNLENMFVLAPRKKFKLGDCDGDPLLFTRVGENHYMLIAQWGGDLSPWRKLVLWPMRSAGTAAITILALALILTAIVPDSLLLGKTGAREWPLRGLLFIQCLFIITSISVLITFSRFRDFSTNEWNSKYYNG